MGKFSVNLYKLSEDVAEDNFSQIYDDLTDAHGYLTDQSNKRLYKKLGWDLEYIRNQFKKIYDHYQRYLSYNEILEESRLIEKFEDITDDLERNGKVKDSIMSQLSKITSKPNWRYVNSLNCCGDNAAELIDNILDDLDHLTEDSPQFRAFLISDNKDEPLGIIFFILKENKTIQEILLVGFKENNVTLAKDCFELFDRMIHVYSLIEWSVNIENPIKKAYLKFIKKYPYHKVSYKKGFIKFAVSVNKEGLDTLSLKESKELIGDCTEIGDNFDLPWEDATEFSQDLGYYTCLDPSDGKKEDSNFEEIPKKEFDEICNNILDGDDFIYIRNRNVYIAYSPEEDIHYIFM